MPCRRRACSCRLQPACTPRMDAVALRMHTMAPQRHASHRVVVVMMHTPLVCFGNCLARERVSLWRLHRFRCCGMLWRRTCLPCTCVTGWRVVCMCGKCWPHTWCKRGSRFNLWNAIAVEPAIAPRVPQLTQATQLHSDGTRRHTQRNTPAQSLCPMHHTPTYSCAEHSHRRSKLKMLQLRLQHARLPASTRV